MILRPVLLICFGVAHHARGPVDQSVIACERLCQLLGVIDGKRLGWLGRPNHTRTQNKKGPLRISLRACRMGFTRPDVDFDTVNFGSDKRF